MTRKDQVRAQTAYKWADAAPKGDLKRYQVAVQGFAGSLLGSGLAAAMSVLERNQDAAEYKLLLTQLSEYKLPAVGAAGITPERVRALDLLPYMTVTRETIALLTWMVRACRARNAREEAREEKQRAK